MRKKEVDYENQMGGIMTFFYWCNIVDYSPAKGLGKNLTNNIFNIVIFGLVSFFLVQEERSRLE